MLTFLRIILAACKDIGRNVWLSFAVVVVMLLTLTTMHGLLVLHALSEQIIASVHQQVDVEVSFLPDTSEDIEKSLRGYVGGFSQVRSVTLVSRDEILAEVRANHANDPDVLAALDEVGENPYGDVLRVELRSPEDAALVREAIQSPEFAPYIGSVDSPDYEAFTRSVVRFTDRLRLGVIFLAVFFGFISFLMLVNALRVAMYVHKDEIFIMRLVGAKRSFVSGPFLCETALLSLISVGIMGVITWFSLPAIDRSLQAFFGSGEISLFTLYKEHFLSMIGLEIAILLFLSTLTTAVAMRKYLRA
jgi:cell division transport system permease protein